jgi:RNA methyltransferase, TrmH family
MVPPTSTRIASRSNPVLARVRRLQADSLAYRKLGQVWLEGDHLLRAAVARGWRLPIVLLPEDDAEDAAWRPLRAAADKVLLVEPRLWRQTSALASPVPIGALVDLPPPSLGPGLRTVVLDRVQDAGNLGSMLRSAAALGVQQVLALKGCAGLWSPKVMRAAMGAHFALGLREEGSVDDITALRVPLVTTSSHAGSDLAAVQWPDPCAWVFGHEGGGVSEELQRLGTLRARIAQPGGEESLNVAAAAAVCLYEAMRQRGQRRVGNQ